MEKECLRLSRVSTICSHIHASLDNEIERPLTLKIAKRIDDDENKRYIALNGVNPYKKWWEEKFKLGKVDTTEKFHTVKEVFDILGRSPFDYEIMCDWQIQKLVGVLCMNFYLQLEKSEKNVLAHRTQRNDTFEFFNF